MKFKKIANWFSEFSTVMMFSALALLVVIAIITLAKMIVGDAEENLKEAARQNVESFYTNSMNVGIEQCRRYATEEYLRRMGSGSVVVCDAESMEIGRQQAMCEMSNQFERIMRLVREIQGIVESNNTRNAAADGVTTGKVEKSEEYERPDIGFHGFLPLRRKLKVVHSCMRCGRHMEENDGLFFRNISLLNWLILEGMEHECRNGELTVVGVECIDCYRRSKYTLYEHDDESPSEWYAFNVHKTKDNSKKKKEKED